MKKKVLYQNHIIFWVSMVFYLAVIVGGGWCIWDTMANISPDNKSWIWKLVASVASVVFFVGLYLFIEGAIRFVLYRIQFYEDRLFTAGTKGIVSSSDRKFRVQYKTEIRYEDIENIGLLYVDKNSQKRRMPSYHHLAIGWRNNLFYTFTLKNGKTKWLYISTFSKKQRIKMLELINLYANTNFSYETMKKIDESYSIYKGKKKKEE